MPKKLMITVVTTISTAIVAMIAPYCRNIGNRRVEKMVDAVERIEKCQSPEADQRQPVAPHRLPQQDRHEVIHQSPAQRRDEQAHQVVDEQSADGPALVPARRSIAAGNFPSRTSRNVQTNAAMKYHSVTYSGPLVRAIGTMKLMATSSSPAKRERVDPDRRLAPFDSLRPSENGSWASDATLACSVGPNTIPTAVAQHDDLPGHEDEPGQAPIGNRLERQPRDGPVQAPQERVRQKAVSDGVGVDHPPAARRQQLDAAQRVPIAPIAAPSAARPASKSPDRSGRPENRPRPAARRRDPRGVRRQRRGKLRVDHDFSGCTR